MTHTTAQPGLHDYSWRPADDLLKEWLVERSLGENRGWLAVASFDEYDEAEAYYIQKRNDGDWTPFRISNQFSKGGVTFK